MNFFSLCIWQVSLLLKHLLKSKGLGSNITVSRDWQITIIVCLHDNSTCQLFMLTLCLIAMYDHFDFSRICENCFLHLIIQLLRCYYSKIQLILLLIINY